MYECRNFKIEELVPPETIDYFKARGGKDRAWAMFDDEVLLTIDYLRDDLGPCTINDWLWGGIRHYSGFRPSGCPIGSEYSYHRIAKAFDMKFKDVSAEEARKHIRENRERFKYIKGVELGFWKGGKKEPINWVHIDFRNTEFKEFWM